MNGIVLLIGHGQDGKQHWHRRTTMEREVLKQALEALQFARDQIVDPEYHPIGWGVSRLDEVLSIGKQALAAQPAQEPYGYYDEADGMFTKTGFYLNESELIAKGRIFAFYTTPPAARVAEIERLTEELKKANLQTEHFEREWYLRGDEIERIKAAQPAQEPVCPACKAGVLYECVACSSNNYPPQGAQKPVAWMWKDMSGTELVSLFKPRLNPVPLYTAPPKRPWVEPTGNDWFEWWRASPVADATEAEIDFADFLIIAQAVTDKLKEDNK
jgi:hypothetical protein